MPAYTELLAPQYSVPEFRDVFSSPDEFVSFYSAIPTLESEVNSTFLNKLWFMLYAQYGSSPIVLDDIHQWKYLLLNKINAYAPTYIKKDEIQKALRALNLDDLREGYKNIFNHAINPSKAPSTDNTEELPYISDQNVNKSKKNKADAYATLWDILRTNIMEEFIRKFADCFSKVVPTSDRVFYIQ